MKKYFLYLLILVTFVGIFSPTTDIRAQAVLCGPGAVLDAVTGIWYTNDQFTRQCSNVCPAGTTGGPPNVSPCIATTVDVCPNIAGIQTSIPNGMILQNGQCLAQTSGGGTCFNNSGVPTILSQTECTGMASFGYYWVPSNTTCPSGTTGTPPNCTPTTTPGAQGICNPYGGIPFASTSAQCRVPPNLSWVPCNAPNTINGGVCTQPSGCPAGFTGTPPNCRPIISGGGTAGDYTLIQSLPCKDGLPGCPANGNLTKFNTKEESALCTYLNLMINLFIGLCAVVAVVMITIGGIEYSTSELTSSKAAGKDKIQNALLGLLLALMAWLLLNTINPDILNICSAVGDNTTTEQNEEISMKKDTVAELAEPAMVLTFSSLVDTEYCEDTAMPEKPSFFGFIKTAFAVLPCAVINTTPETNNILNKCEVAMEVARELSENEGLTIDPAFLLAIHANETSSGAVLNDPNIWCTIEGKKPLKILDKNCDLPKAQRPAGLKCWGGIKNAEVQALIDLMDSQSFTWNNAAPTSPFYGTNRPMSGADFRFVPLSCSPQKRGQNGGAMGGMQFMPTSWKIYGLDRSTGKYGNPWNYHDAMKASARHLLGGRTTIPENKLNDAACAYFGSCSRDFPYGEHALRNMNAIRTLLQSDGCIGVARFKEESVPSSMGEVLQGGIRFPGIFEDGPAADKFLEPKNCLLPGSEENEISWTISSSLGISNAVAKVNIPSHLYYVSSSYNPVVSGSVLTFNLGSIPAGEKKFGFIAGVTRTVMGETSINYTGSLTYKNTKGKTKTIALDNKPDKICGREV